MNQTVIAYPGTRRTKAQAKRAHFTPLIAPKILDFLSAMRPATPCLIVDLEKVEQQYDDLCKALPYASCYYSVKANPAPDIIRMLQHKGSNFDAASLQEIKLCLELGTSADRILFGSTIKKQSDITEAYALGVRTYTFDSEAELLKLAESAPGARLFCRIHVPEMGASWPLSKKFGCKVEEAIRLLTMAAAKGMAPYGVSFHVGSQQRLVSAWDEAIRRAAFIWKALEKHGIHLQVLNLGGGFPAQYRDPIPTTAEYGAGIRQILDKHFDGQPPACVMEPGRYMAGDAGVIQAEVVLISEGKEDDNRRWVYLDIGKFTGLVEAEDIEYRIITEKDGTPTGPVVLAGPTCDSIDIIYEKKAYELPLSLEVGDKVYFLSTGAYTTTYSAVSFNGFPPLKDYYIS